ncbi:hypothetical protein K7887_07035 [Sutcliffiella horikoshii]|uniref:hypothetical protein n=1 Tax=Sutcliffiella horikoshii TaxID=79883 RepID=UPI001CBCDD92|nr:hypothetical protein [Sutcliffiella horikoshii]UAL48680.1 hypothetical protein K7887_07035 [Sutcliffiella horikoshii]
MGNLNEMNKQILIHYKAEITKYKNRLHEIQMQLQKEKTRTLFWENKYKEVKFNQLDRLVGEINKLKEKVMLLEVELEEERKISSEITIKPIDQPIITRNKDTIYSYFNYTFIVSKEESLITILADFHIENNSTLDYEDLILCLKVTSRERVSLTGKISNPDLLEENNPSQSGEWVYATKDWKEKIRSEGEYWIRPTRSPNLKKNESLSFKGWEITINQRSSKLTVDGFLYSSGLPSPLKAVNRINLKFT